MQWINLSSFVAGNIYVLSGRCKWFDPFAIAMGSLQWTCWNTLFLMGMVRPAEPHNVLSSPA